MHRIIVLPLLACLAGCDTSSLPEEKGVLGVETIDAGTHFPQDWAEGTTGRPSFTFGSPPWRLDSVEKHSGRYALTVDSDDEAEEAFVSHLMVKRMKASSVALTAYVRTKDVVGGARIWLRLEGKGGRLLTYGSASRAVSGTKDWGMVSVMHLVPKGEVVRRIRIGASLEGRGKVWVDDFRVVVDGTEFSEVPEDTTGLLPAERDTAFLHGSGIQTIALTPHRTESLATLGALWGFMKYHHAGVQRGGHNMDAALFRVLPRILGTTSREEAGKVMEQWMDDFGMPPPCRNCPAITDIDSVALAPDYGVLFQKDVLPASLASRLDYIRKNRQPPAAPHHYVHANPQPPNAPHFYISVWPGIGNPIFRNEEDYGETAYPDAGVRLLALFRYWNIIQYFYPNRHLIGEDWNRVLLEEIPEFCAAPDALAYHTACLKLIGRIHDSHAGLHRSLAVEEAKGRWMTPFKAGFIEDELVVTGYYKSPIPEVRVGDVIRRIDGVPVASLVEKYRALNTGSNSTVSLRRMASAQGHLLRGHRRPVALTIMRDGGEREVAVNRIPFSPSLPIQEKRKPAVEKGFGILQGNIGYFFPASLTDSSIHAVKAALHNTRALIIDLRCYPAPSTMKPYAQWLKADSTADVMITAVRTDVPGLFQRRGMDYSGGRNRTPYRGKVIILVNEVSQSYSEWAAMQFQTVPGAVTIGSSTSGADGNVSEIILPGGLRTMISGIGVLYPDGKETQRVGVRVDKVVRPTAAGIRAGKDEVLEAALRLAGG